MEPRYTHANCTPRYQLNWAICLFWRESTRQAAWLPELRSACDADRVRILNHRFRPPNASQFVVSTTPGLAPSQAVRSVKARLQYLLRASRPRAFRRNYGLRSIGSASRKAVEEYVDHQHVHHPMADPATDHMLRRFVHHDASVDLGAGRAGAHCLFWYNLHVVLVNSQRWREIDSEKLDRAWRMIQRAAGAKRHLLSRAALLADHIHLVLGCQPAQAPGDVALSYMNNVAWVWEMRPVLEYSFYVGTVGEYDVWVPGMGRREE